MDQLPGQGSPLCDLPNRAVILPAPTLELDLDYLNEFHLNMSVTWIQFMVSFGFFDLFIHYQSFVFHMIPFWV